MANVDMNEVVRQMVADEVEKVLGPYRATIERLGNAFGMSAAPARARRGPGGPAAAPRAARGAGRAPRIAPGDASKFKEGQSVKYKQGRGEFVASVEKVDTEGNMLTLKREKDGKKVQRPAGKVYAA